MATLLQWGWGFVGPTLAVGLDAGGRARLLWTSMLSRALVGAVLLPAGAALAASTGPPGYRLLTALTAVAIGMLGMSAYWFFVGTGRPGQAARYETLPRLAVQLLSAGAVLATGQLLWYPAVFLVGQILTIGYLTNRLAAVGWRRGQWAAALDALRDQRASAATDLVVATAATAPISVLAAVAPGSLAVFAACDRVQKLAQSGIQPLYNAFQGWVSEDGLGGGRRRMQLAVGTTSVAGLVAGLVVAVGLPVVDSALFGGAVQVGFQVSVLFGAAFAVWALVSAITFDVLAPSRRSGVILVSTLVGAGLALAGMSVLPRTYGAAGGGFAVLAGQVGSLVVQCAALGRGLHPRRRQHASPTA
ncbi:hypothetical protein [Klenkia sp. PcliD-1-E]|uniref:hypothetical protein n=1 Tax=Klenkia sp. PcliD-1-E TaxID=2954492 RepID=UPI0020978A34|nr:hypothetical protein [Klenkia sp. PcliD-1-E]MCO7221265.1 hypothetical protein [Klenkia sp. PcliD-1-E]